MQIIPRTGGQPALHSYVQGLLEEPRLDLLNMGSELTLFHLLMVEQVALKFFNSLDGQQRTLAVLQRFTLPDDHLYVAMPARAASEPWEVCCFTEPEGSDRLGGLVQLPAHAVVTLAGVGDLEEVRLRHE